MKPATNAGVGDREYVGGPAGYHGVGASRSSAVSYFRRDFRDLVMDLVAQDARTPGPAPL